MKHLKLLVLFVLTLAIALSTLTSCDIASIKDTVMDKIDGLLGNNEENPEDNNDQTPDETPDNGETPKEDAYNCITVAKALELCDSNPTERYNLRVIVKEIKNDQYGEMTVKDSTGEIYVYGTYSEDGSKKFNEIEDQPKVGDEIVISCVLATYNKTKEVQNARLLEVKHNEAPETPDAPAAGSYITVAEAIALCSQSPSGRYNIRATVVTVISTQYGEMRIADSTGEIYVYGTRGADGATFFDKLEDQPVKGDEIVVSCELNEHNGTPQVKQAWLLEVKHNDVTVDESEYEDVTIAAAREKATGAKVKVDGVVAAITYASGKKPDGVLLVDETSSIYVYGADLAGRVKVGNTVTVVGEKAMFIAENEASFAQTHGYSGACQISNISVISIDDTTSEFNKTWITETTVKDIIDTPFNVNITSKLFKVTATIVKDQQTGYVNYYIDDLDGETGSYVYTKCNGSDFTWLDEFDGKTCTVYMTALNAKSTQAGCVYRFLPVLVIDEGYSFDLDDTAEHVVKYYGVNQFDTLFNADPAITLTTTFSSETLGYTNATLTFTSNNTEVVYFETDANGNLVMHCGKSGTATVTVSSTYNGKTYSETVDVVVNIIDLGSYVNVNAAINSATGTVVTVRGIVGPSLVNQVGFYLIDETGAVPVKLADTTKLANIKIGNDIVLKGTRNVTRDGNGQIVIENCEIIANLYGNHDYSTASFITGKTLAEITASYKNYDASKDHLTTVQTYVVEVTVKFNAQNITLVDSNGNSIMLYTGNTDQYSWLKAYDGQTITVELALCNWNNRGIKGCVLAVYTNDGKTLNQLHVSEQ